MINFLISVDKIRTERCSYAANSFLLNNKLLSIHSKFSLIHLIMIKYHNYYL